jgi:hypothetical protein
MTHPEGLKEQSKNYYLYSFLIGKNQLVFRILEILSGTP